MLELTAAGANNEHLVGNQLRESFMAMGEEKGGKEENELSRWTLTLLLWMMDRL